MTFEELKEIARNRNAYYCGATNKPRRRKNEHSRKGKNGTMYYAQVDDAQYSENVLLSMKHWRGNIQKTSGYHNKNGGLEYVYVIA